MTSQKTNLLSRLRNLDSSALSDVLDNSGWPGQVLLSSIVPVEQSMKIVGRATCFRGEVANSIDASARSQPGEQQRGTSPYSIEQYVDADSVVVISVGKNAYSSVLGGLMARSLRQCGCQGFLTDGGVRDRNEIADLDFAVFSSFLTPLNSARRWKIIEAGAEIRLPGQSGSDVIVHPGDYILGDCDGVVVIPENIIEPIVTSAEVLKSVEDQIVKDLDKGVPREAAFSRNPRFAHVPDLRSYYQG